jgi:tRNA-binding protein
LSETDGHAPFESFAALDIRVGRVLGVEEFPEARVPAWKLTIDFGPEVGQKRSSAQITHYTREQLEGRTVVGVLNFPPRRIAGFASEVLVLGAMDPEKGVVLLTPDDPDVELGSKIA